MYVYTHNLWFSLHNYCIIMYNKYMHKQLIVAQVMITICSLCVRISVIPNVLAYMQFIVSTIVLCYIYA